MTPAERGPAIRRLLMLTAGGIDTDDSLHTVHDLLRTFDDLDAATDLACSIAAQTVTVANTLPPDVLGGFLITDPPDLIAFAMLGHADAHGTEHLAGHLALLPLQHRLAVAIALLAMWRQANLARITSTLTDWQPPEHVDDVASPICTACGSRNVAVYVNDPTAYACDDCGAERPPYWQTDRQEPSA